MNNGLNRAEIKMHKTRTRKKWWQRLVSSLTAVVVFCTTYALILPALTMEGEPVCGMEAHEHTADCFREERVTTFHCDLDGESQVLHTHDTLCYDAQGSLVCPLEENGAHIHEDGCYVTEITDTLLCGGFHLHDEGCADAGGNVTCTEETAESHVHDEGCYELVLNPACGAGEAVTHVHDEGCVTVTTERIRICGLAEHIHSADCYPAEEDSRHSSYTCGSGVHVHEAGCFDENGVKTCSIPEHTHEAACLVADLDLTADVETEEQWRESLADTALTGNWAQDVLLLAQSQLDYQESTKNVILEGDTLKGYTRYGAWYGEPYGDWDAMFIAFCMHYAEITEEYMPYASDTARWVETLRELGIFEDADVHTPAAGELVFLDTDADGKADLVGIAAGVTQTGEIELIAGDTGNGVVAAITVDPDVDVILGCAVLPENPLTQEQWNETEIVRAMLAELPDAETAGAALQALNEKGDKAGYEALRQEIAARVQAIRAAYDAMNEMQRARVGSLEQAAALEAVCGGWQDFPALEDDSVLLTGLTVAEAEVIRASEADPDSTGSIIRNQDVLHYSITGEVQSYYSDLSFGEVRVKVELVLPLTEDKARFDTDAMAWLEDPVLTAETREGIDCQVLTGYKRMTGTDAGAIVTPGSFTETVAVKILNMAHGEQLSLIVSAAVEHGTWEGLCQTHLVEEKITVQTQAFTLDDPRDAELRSETCTAFLAQIQALTSDGTLTEEAMEEAAYALKDQIVAAYYEGLLDAAELALLGDALREPLKLFAEYATGISWLLPARTQTLSANTYALSRTMSVAQTTALDTSTYNTVFASDEQIDEEGGGKTSDDGAVYVSKTIEGTDAENVFDITLEIITKEEVNEVYREPDMAVVVVMDISNTMTSSIGSSTTSRYEAAMQAAADFMQTFAENTDGLSKLGYVAFNTHAHEIFGLSSCSTEAEATALTNTMRTKTGNILGAAGYASSGNRFTNIEAGLKMANDMLEGATNQNKYIIFISDGFPTTYLKSGYTGYNPYTSSGNKNNNGVFYDDVLDVYCSYGTSYSDTAAIKAREMAVALKEEGVNIFSIGVDVSGQNLWYYHNSSYNTRSSHSIFERREEYSYYNTNGYEIGTYHYEFANGTVPLAESAVDQTALAQDFKDWLKGTDTTGIGSGYYYDSTDTKGLKDAYTQIFQKILEMNAASSHLDWVATDPMPGMGVHELSTIEFIGFWDVNGDLQSALSGISADGEEYENTASFNTETQTISWDLKNSRYISQQSDSTTLYRMWMTYRVRLKNESGDFVENQSYDTNDLTSLTYRIIEITNDVTSISEQRTISFPIPAVHGYLSELTFQKVDPAGKGLVGAGFTLSHDVESCRLCTELTDADGNITRYASTCAGEGVDSVDIADMVAYSGTEGMVTFSNIPSGHIYTLTETEVPQGYIATGNTYQVVVSYDAQTVTVLDANGDPLEWTSTIENDMYYALPNTGSVGTEPIAFGGLLIIAAALMYITLGRRRRKGGNDQRD